LNDLDLELVKRNKKKRGRKVNDRVRQGTALFHSWEGEGKSSCNNLKEMGVTGGERSADGGEREYFAFSKRGGNSRLLLRRKFWEKKEERRENMLFSIKVGRKKKEKRACLALLDRKGGTHSLMVESEVVREKKKKERS